MIEIIEMILGSIIFLGMACFAIFGSIAVSEEKAIRRKQWEAGTHDYYGNKLKDQLWTIWL